MATQTEWQRFIISHAAVAEQRGGPSSARRKPDRGQPPPLKPYPNRRRRPAARVPSGNEKYDSGNRDRQRLPDPGRRARRATREAPAPKRDARADRARRGHRPRVPGSPRTPVHEPLPGQRRVESANSVRRRDLRIAASRSARSRRSASEGSDAASWSEDRRRRRPIHTDATAKIRPRIFLEGNFFVDLQTGSPDAPELEDGGTLKVTQTATPVQLDEVLTALQSDTREDLKDLLEAFAVALNSEPTAAEDRSSAPMARGETAAESFNDAYDDIPDAERSTAQVFEALLGTEPGHDISRLIDGTARTTAALARNENALQGLITNLNATMAAFASEAATCARRSPSCPAPSSRPTARSPPSTPRSPHARVRARDPARRAETRPRSRPRSRGSSRRAR